jgi:hypothetical protein
LEILGILFNLINEQEILGDFLTLCEVERLLTFGTRHEGVGSREHLVHAGLAEGVQAWKGQRNPLFKVIVVRTDLALGDQVTCVTSLHLFYIDIIKCKN